MTKRSPNFARVLGTGTLGREEITAVFELAYAMANADGSASFDELDTFRALVKHLQPSANVADLLDGLSAKFDRAESIEGIVREAAARLTRLEARDAAYKAAYTIAVFDLETNEEERELDDLLIEVLGLSQRADDLEAQVNDVLNA